MTLMERQVGCQNRWVPSLVTSGWWKWQREAAGWQWPVLLGKAGNSPCQPSIGSRIAAPWSAKPGERLVDQAVAVSTLLAWLGSGRSQVSRACLVESVDGVTAVLTEKLLAAVLDEAAPLVGTVM